MKTTLDSQGRIALPEEIRAALGLKPGDEVILEHQNGQCVIRPEETSLGLSWEGNVLVHQGVSGASVENTLCEAREERLDQLTQGLSG